MKIDSQIHKASMNMKYVTGTLAAAGLVACGAGFQAHKAQAATELDSNYQTTVEAGDTYSAVAEKFGVNLDALMKANADHPDYNLIYPGDKITVPQAGSQQAQPQPAASQSQAPAASESNTTASQPVQQQPVQQPAQAATPAPAAGAEQSAKEWIASKESGGSYGAQNGRYVGRYQLDSSYLNGDYSEANQEAVANNYVMSRYGSWQAAQAFWQANGWY